MMKFYMQLAVAVALFFSGYQRAFGQDYLSLAQTEAHFGKLDRSADVLLAEADANVARTNLAMLLQEYSHGQAALLELRRRSRIGLLDPGSMTPEELTKSMTQHEQFVSQTEHAIREVSAKLDSTWLLPVQTNLDDQQLEALLDKSPQLLVTMRSKSGSVLQPVKLTLTSPTDAAIGFSEVLPGVYLAAPPAGEYQLAWQLSDKSIVQRKTAIQVEKAGCLKCEITLDSPDIKITTATIDAALPQFPRRSKKTTEKEIPTLGRPGGDNAPPSLE